jgi:hypothetical protein
MKLVRLIKMCLSESYSRVRLGKNFSAMFLTGNGLKKGDALSPLFFNVALVFAIRRVKVFQDCLKLNGINELLVYGNDVNVLGGSVRTIRENAEALVVAG